MNTIYRKKQQTIDWIAQWATINGFKFLATRTVCMTFYNIAERVLQPTLKISKYKILSMKETKFMEFGEGEKLKWSVLYAKMKAKCMRTMNLMRILSGLKCRADQETLMRVYRIFIRPVIDYYCVVYGAASC